MSLRARLAAGLLALGAAAAQAEPYYVIVAGLGGQPEYQLSFDEQADALAEAARRTTGDEARVKMLRGEDATRDAISSAFASLAREMSPNDTLIVFLVGHGTFDGERYKLNLPGPDPTGEELNAMLAAVPARSQLIVNATSASGAVLEEWSADGRTVVTATRSGVERNATRFAEHWAAALSSDEADIDKNGTISAQEAFDYAARSVEDSYESEGALATEHPRLAGDNAPRFTVARLTERPTQTPELERQSARMAEIEGEIEALRLRRDEMEPDAYLDELQALLLQLATVQQEIDRAEAAAGAPAAESNVPAEQAGQAPSPERPGQVPSPREQSAEPAPEPQRPAPPQPRRLAPLQQL